MPDLTYYLHYCYDVMDTVADSDLLQSVNLYPGASKVVA